MTLVTKARDLHNFVIPELFEEYLHNLCNPMV